MGSANDLSTFQQPRSAKWTCQQLILIGLVLSCLLATLPSSFFPLGLKTSTIKLTRTQQASLKASIDRCNALRTPAGSPPGFTSRTRSDRAIEESPPILIRNVTLWTGKPEEGDGIGEVREGVDVYVSDGIIQSIERTGERKPLKHETIIEGNGAWMTPGIIDVSRMIVEEIFF
jgi:hypothetical protein